MKDDYKLIVFDVDGTLTVPWKEELLPGVKDWFRVWRLAKLNGNAPDVALATNQGGPALRAWMEQDGWGEPEKFPTIQDVIARLSSVKNMLSDNGRLVLPLYISTAYKTGNKDLYAPFQNWMTFGDDRKGMVGRHYVMWRKPQPGMLLALAHVYEYSPALKQCLAVGDHDADEIAARRAGFDFKSNSDFFIEQRGIKSAISA